jgi:hypothetical protein
MYSDGTVSENVHHDTLSSALSSDPASTNVPILPIIVHPLIFTSGAAL